MQHAAVAAQPGETGELLFCGVLSWSLMQVTSLTAETNSSMSAWS